MKTTLAIILSLFCLGTVFGGPAYAENQAFGLVYADPTVSFGGRVVGGLRIRKAPGAPKAAAPVRDGVPFNDEVPF